MYCQGHTRSRASEEFGRQHKIFVTPQLEDSPVLFTGNTAAVGFGLLWVFGAEVLKLRKSSII